MSEFRTSMGARGTGQFFRQEQIFGQEIGTKRHGTGVPFVTPVAENRFRDLVSWPVDCIMMVGPGVLAGRGRQF